MPRVEFIISNDRHHMAMVRPVLEALAAKPEYTCGLISLAELRGLASPDDLPGRAGDALPVSRVVPRAWRRALRLRPSAGVGEHWTRRAIRAMAWRLWMGPRLAPRLGRADLVVTPNDGAFPYDRICSLLRRRGIPFLLLQEGIRFPRPAGADVRYGLGGAAAIAAWGESSAAYFRSRGVPPERISLTGSPRFDGLRAVDWPAQAAALGSRLGLERRNLLLLGSPIDMMGYCATAEKAAIMRRFFEELGPLFADPEFHVLVKLHAAESPADFTTFTRGVPDPGRVHVLEHEPLYPLFHLSRAAIVLASTAGLEAMLFDVPVGVLEIPGVGFVHDYVRRGAAAGLSWSASLTGQVGALMAPSAARQRAMREYIEENLATLEGAAERVVNLIDTLVPR